MIVLERKVGEKLEFGEEKPIKIKIVSIGLNTVRLLIDLPDDVLLKTDSLNYQLKSGNGWPSLEEVKQATEKSRFYREFDLGA